VILLHGWNGSSESLRGVANWLRQQGVDSVDIHLGDYLSLNDELTLRDLGFAFRRALAAKNISQDRHSFNLVVHSTGGLVAREYLRQVCDGDVEKTPIQHLCMLAPANFGSPLAKIGKSMRGRLFFGWGWDHLGETGTRILNCLELASPYTWELAEDDLFDARFPVFSPENTLLTVMVGTNGYTGPRSIVNENGSDGTVRVSTANLNAHLFRFDLAEPTQPTLTEVKRNFDKAAFAVFHRTHGSILDPTIANQQPLWTDTLWKALTIGSQQYPDHIRACDAIAAQTFQEGLAANTNPDWYHKYMHVVFRVQDQYGQPVTDYFVEFYQEEGDPMDIIFQKIHAEILEKATTNEIDPSYRSLLFDCSDLTDYLDSSTEADVKMSLGAVAVSTRIGYRNPPNVPSAGVNVFSSQRRIFLIPNEPVLVDVRLYRDPSSNVFVLS